MCLSRILNRVLIIRKEEGRFSVGLYSGIHTVDDVCSFFERERPFLKHLRFRVTSLAARVSKEENPWSYKQVSKTLTNVVQVIHVCKRLIFWRCNDELSIETEYNARTAS